MADLTIWISGADFIKINSFFALEGSIFLKLFWLKSAEIRAKVLCSDSTSFKLAQLD